MGKESNEGSGELFVCLYSLGHNVSHNLLRLGTFESVKSNMQAVALAFLSCLRTRNDKDGAQGEGEGEDYCRETHLHVKILVTVFFHQYFFFFFLFVLPPQFGCEVGLPYILCTNRVVFSIR